MKLKTKDFNCHKIWKICSIDGRVINAMKCGDYIKCRTEGDGFKTVKFTCPNCSEENKLK